MYMGGEISVGRVARSRQGKGQPPPRACPGDYDVIFVEQGRLACESWYRARRDTVTRWMHERDVVRKATKLPTLIEARAAYVAHQRANGKWMTRQTPLVEKRAPRPVIARAAPVRDRRKVSFTLARHAAQFLRIMRNGGHIISLASNGDWWIGTRRVSAAQLLDEATKRGFEPMGVPADA